MNIKVLDIGFYLKKTSFLIPSLHITTLLSHKQGSYLSHWDLYLSHWEFYLSHREFYLSHWEFYLSHLLNSKIFFANLRESSRKFRVSRKKALPLHRHSEGDASTRVARTELTNNLTWKGKSMIQSRYRVVALQYPVICSFAAPGGPIPHNLARPLIGPPTL